MSRKYMLSRYGTQARPSSGDYCGDRAENSAALSDLRIAESSASGFRIICAGQLRARASNTSDLYSGRRVNSTNYHGCGVSRFSDPRAHENSFHNVGMQQLRVYRTSQCACFGIDRVFGFARGGKTDSLIWQSQKNQQSGLSSLVSSPTLADWRRLSSLKGSSPCI
jgi:hypothetical protein